MSKVPILPNINHFLVHYAEDFTMNVTKFVYILVYLFSYHQHQHPDNHILPCNTRSVNLYQHLGPKMADVPPAAHQQQDEDPQTMLSFFFNLWLLKQPQGFYLFQSILLLTCLGDHRGQESSTTDIEHDRAVTCSKHKTYMGRGRWSPAYKIM